MLEWSPASVRWINPLGISHHGLHMTIHLKKHHQVSVSQVTAHLPKKCIQSCISLQSSSCRLHSPAFGANSGGPSCGAFLRAPSAWSFVCTKFLVLYVPDVQKVWFSYVLLSALCLVVPSVERSSHTSKIKSPDENPMMLAQLMRAKLLMRGSVLWNTPVLFGPQW
jgi:hypothetical protein